MTGREGSGRGGAFSAYIIFHLYIKAEECGLFLYFYFYFRLSSELQYIASFFKALGIVNKRGGVTY